MKIIILPGVGLHDDTTKYEEFAKYIGNKLNCQSEMFYWKHDWPLPEITLPYDDIRKLTYEVMLDFQQVVLHAFDTPVPKADYYIAHSAGSILALAQKNIPCVIFGSPAILVECIHRSGNKEFNSNVRFMEAIREQKNILNIINKYDQLAYYLDLPNVENYVFQGSWCNPSTYNPVETHTGYWENLVVRKKILETIKKWEGQKST